MFIYTQFLQNKYNGPSIYYQCQLLSSQIWHIELPRSDPLEVLLNLNSDTGVGGEVNLQLKIYEGRTILSLPLSSPLTLLFYVAFFLLQLPKKELDPKDKRHFFGKW